ncbi:tetratricopeptide repeat protein [Xanthomonas massiliensis]|uniref:tetratricopeptide repeat protein n=1 Tax=Xanthomonas massiliensis TaxID=1720302 RepID=UPI000ACBF995|nr:tetratricopeptide repeat protein [Xanthomonas massiliensis]
MSFRPTASHALLAALLLPLAACRSDPSGYVRPDPDSLARMAEAEADPKPDDRGTYLALIEKMQSQKAWFASLAHIDAFRQRFGNFPGLQLMQARALHETGQLDAAEPLYRGLLNGPLSAAAWHGLGLIAALHQDPDTAMADLSRAVQRDPLNATYLGDLGFACLRAGDLERARMPLAKAAELDPADARTIANLALWTLLNGEPGKADAIMHRANLPQATRDSVFRMSAELRSSWPRAPTGPLRPDSTQNPAADGRSAAARAAPSHPPVASAKVQPPGNLLQRFSESPDNSSEKAAR